MRRKGCAKGAIGKRPGRPRREGCAGVVLGERDLLDLAIFSDFLAALINLVPSGSQVRECKVGPNGEEGTLWGTLY